MPPRAPVNSWRLLLAADVGEGSVGSAEGTATVSRVVGDVGDAEATPAFVEELELTVGATVAVEDVGMLDEAVASSEEVEVSAVVGSELTLVVAEELVDTGSPIALGDAVEAGADPKVTVNAALAVAVPETVTVTVEQVVQVVEASRGTT
jgi:hypothetical protein